MRNEIWRLTTLGKNRARDIYSEEAKGSVMAYLYQNKTASVEELSSVSGKSVGEVKSYLRGIGPSGSGLAEPLGGGY